MAAGVFRVREILPSKLSGVVFQWTSSETPPFSAVGKTFKGGGRSAPLGAWEQGGSMRTVRTDYTGNPVPSEQVLGSTEEPQNFNGKWDDRYNYKGYAQDTWREFRSLCMRGNLVEISFQGKGYIGILKNWHFAEKRVWDVRYSFGLSIHGTSEDVEKSEIGTDRKIQVNPLEHRDVCDEIAEKMTLDFKLLPTSQMAGGLGDTVAEGIANVSLELNALDDVLDQSDIRASSPFNPLSPFAYLRSKFDAIGRRAATVNQALLQTKSTAELAVVTGKSVLDYEDWSRSMRFHSRLLQGKSLEASEDMDSRDSPDIERLYRAHEGQSLMAISREVYGTPHQWAAIYEANNLESEVLTEPELLIIPNLGTA